MKPGLVGIRGEQSLDGFLGYDGQLFPISPPHQGCTELVRSCFSLHNAGRRGQQREVVGIECNVQDCNGAVKVIKEGWGDAGSLLDTHPPLAARGKVSLVEKICLPAVAEVLKGLGYKPRWDGRFQTPHGGREQEPLQGLRCRVEQ